MHVNLVISYRWVDAAFVSQPIFSSAIQEILIVWDCIAVISCLPKFFPSFFTSKPGIDSCTLLTSSSVLITSASFSLLFPVASWIVFNSTLFIVPLLLSFLTIGVSLRANERFLISFFAVPSSPSRSSWGRLFFALRSSSWACLMSFPRAGLTRTAILLPTVSCFSISS